MLIDLNDLFFFASVVEHQGFAAAGRALGIPKSKLSRRVALLEERLGVRLIQRSTRRFSITDVGQNYYQHCKAMLVEAEAAQQAIEQTRAEPCGTVRLSCPIALLHTRVGDMLARFMADYPKVSLHLEATNRRVDVVGEGLDLALRVRPPPLEDSDLVLKVLAQRSWCVAASPALVRALGDVRQPEDLLRYPTLDLGPARPQHQWTLTGPDTRRFDWEHLPRLVTDDMLMLRTAAIAGAGVVQLPSMMMRDQILRGDMMALLPDWRPQGGVVHAVYPSRRGLLPAVRLLLDFLGQQFAALEES
ncbi:LysR family transcriptional regulator [Serratia odorifera]|uniref:LysR substrate binding domain protein n=2 Tax=Serratia odorifera TaxID=618 RepID=D4DWH9_SEROD|nr:LysR family transcriptional regulator [Serratia odorifera]EFE98234.1 LysR substrate binding domain protein [Serratia odorifera DSM 4582]PNK92499.1 LysR family transcriptional regulator [Serratia odorifera]RII73809.1 LysR family transcriptional regulator [Serratia odorifera]